MQQAKDFDFIVVGSGIAGLNSALTLSSYGNVLVITKKKIKDSSTFFAQGGIAAVTKQDDSVQLHLKDTLTAGYKHNNRQAVQQLVENGQAAVARLAGLGVPFDKKNNGDLISSFEAAHSYPRIVHATDFTGREIENVLVTHAVANNSITIWEHTAALDLITDNKTCIGVQLVKKNKIFTLYSRAVVLATGGIGQLYTITTNPDVSTGDGIAIAYRAGASVQDMEFIQFHPTALMHGTSPLLLLSEALRGDGAILLNSHGERFMQTVHPLGELAPRDVVTRAIFQEQKKGNIYLDIRHKGKPFINKRFPNITKELKKRGFDLTTQQIPVTPAEHFLCGGIKTDLYGRTAIKNLFAYGECAATGVHGANRLASNSLLEGMVFSEQIRHCLQDLPEKIPTKTLPPQTIKKSIVTTIHKDPTEAISSQIREIMWRYVGIIRTTHGLRTAQKKIEKLQKEITQLTTTSTPLFETENMVIVANLIIKAAQKRKKVLAHTMLADKFFNLLQYMQ